MLPENNGGPWSAGNATTRYPTSAAYVRSRAQCSAGNFPPRIKTLPLNRDGYQLVAFQARPRSTTMKVHTVVLTAFVGPRPKGMQACHNDGNPANNSLTNLRWDTPLSNIADAIRQKTHPSVAMKARGNCIRGHEYTEATTYVTPRGTRECRRCRNDQARIRRTRKRAAMNRQLE